MNTFTKPIEKIQPHVIIDRLTICYPEPDPESVKGTCGLILSDLYTKDIPGLKITKNARYAVSARIPMPFMTKQIMKKPSEVYYHPILFEAGPLQPSYSSYRLDFNPSKLSPVGMSDLKLFLDCYTHPTPAEFFQLGIVTRVDAAVDIPGYTIDDLIVRSDRKQKHGVYSDRRGDVETVYLGTPRSARVVGYTNVDPETGEVSVRLECRVKPRCHGVLLAGLPNQFKKVRLISAHALDNLVPGVPGRLIADSIRLRGPKRALKVFDAKTRKHVIAALQAAESFLPDADALWAGWPDALTKVGLGYELGVPALEEVKEAWANGASTKSALAKAKYATKAQQAKAA